MIKLIRNNQKTVVAIIAVISMVGFVVGYGGSSRGGRGGGGATDREVGRAGGAAVMASDVNAAKAEVGAVVTFARQFTRNQPDPNGLLAGQVTVARLARQLLDKPVAFALLRREAAAAGVTVDPTLVQAFMDTHLGGTAEDGSPVDPPAVDSDTYALVRAGVTDLYAGLEAFERVADAFKPSRPAVDRAMADQLQTATFNLAQVRAEPYAVAAPTTRQVADQFRRYADDLPEEPTADNPFGFGYRRPVRVRLQYLRLPRPAVEAAVAATRSEYDWEFQARKLYYKDPAAFPVPPQPPAVVGPTPPPPAAGSEAAYLVVRPKVMAELKDPLVKQLQAQVQQYLTATLAADHAAYVAATGGPTTAPAATSRPAPPSSIDGQPYDTRAYLRAVAAAVGAKFHVQLDTDETPPLSLKQLTDMPTLGKAGPDYAALAAAVGSGPSTGPLPEYVFDQAAAVLRGGAATSLMVPSPAFVEPLPTPDPADASAVAAVDVVRVAAVLPSTPATDLEAVRTRVEEDCRTAAAFAAARAKAGQLAAAAATAGVIAPPPGTPVLKTQPLTPQAVAIDGLQPPLAAAAPTFMADAFALLDGYDPKAHPHPTTSVALPDQQRAFAVQLSQVLPRWTAPDDYFRARLAAADYLRGQAVTAARAAWFEPAAIERRAAYAPANGTANAP